MANMLNKEQNGDADQSYIATYEYIALAFFKSIYK